MELKFEHKGSWFFLIISSNRTFMELKYTKIKRYWYKMLGVLIAPLWN